MGMAHAAPFSTKPPMEISNHALERFRERATSYLKNEGALDDQSVRYRLGWLVKHALDAENFFPVKDTVENKLFRVVDFSDKAFGEAFALVPFADAAVVTVLSRDIVEQNKLSRWVKPDGSRFGTGGTIGERLPGLAALRASVLTPAVAPTPAPAAAPKVEVKPKLEAPSAFMRAVSVGEKFHVFGNEESYLECIESLVRAGTVYRVWKPVKTKVKVSVEEEP